MANPFTPEQISQILEEFFKVVGTRQYIGARYVPIFGRKGEESIEWDNSAPYEPLTIVLYQGNSYTSRQYVPAGVEITNQEFWAITGNYNAQIEAYRKEVRNILPYDETPTEGSTKGVTSDGIKKAIDTAVTTEATRAKEAEQTNATAIANEVTRAKEAEKANADTTSANTAMLNATMESPLKSLVDANTTANTEHTNQLAGTADSGLKTMIDNNALSINKLNEQGILLALGDSFGVATVSKDKWWHTFVAAGLGLADINYCEGYDGFVTTNPTSGKNFLARLNEAYNDASFDNNKVEYVICYGGLNDRSQNDFKVIDAGIEAFIKRMNELYPRAKKIIAGPTSWFQASRNNTNDTIFATFNEAMGSHMRNVCVRNGVTYICMTYETMLISNAYAGMTDGNHFTTYGSALAASTILSSIQGKMFNNVSFTNVPGHYVDASNNRVTEDTRINLRKTANGFRIYQPLITTTAAVNGTMRFVSDTNYFFRFYCQDINVINYWGSFKTKDVFVEKGASVMNAADNTVLGISHVSLDSKANFSYTIDYLQW
jgi:hypothetical protein